MCSLLLSHGDLLLQMGTDTDIYMSLHVKESYTVSTHALFSDPPLDCITLANVHKTDHFTYTLAIFNKNTFTY